MRRCSRSRRTLALIDQLPSIGPLTLARRRGLRILGVAALILSAAAAYNVAHGPRYTASMRVLVSPGTATLSLGEAAAGTTLLVADHGQAARNLAALLADPGMVAPMLPGLPARARREDVVARAFGALGGQARAIGEAVGLVDARREEQRGEARLSQAFTVAALGDTDVLKLDLTWDDPRFAASALGAIAAGTAQAVSGAAEARTALARAQAVLRQAQDEADAQPAPVPAAAAAQKAELAARIAAASATADQIRLALELARRGVAATEAAYRGGGWVGATDGGKPARAFADLLERKQTLTGAATQDAGAIAAIDARIAQLREQNYRRARARGGDEVAGAQARLAVVQASLDADQAAWRDIDAQDAQAIVAVQVRAGRLAALAQARAQLRLAEQRIDGAWQEVGAVRVLSPARVPDAPDWPGPGWILRVATGVGLGLGVLSAALAERARRTIDYPGDITHRLGLEVLARLGEQKAGGSR